ncbi:hypothetical protein GCM10010170_077680 [Dactylosporangium salmoneum]|uniref:Uncharacterized protein n=1 Tax=Dactylosporangium salmoneum TaxID=53361 RepID=A0ABP5UAE7_9ACTN
MQIFVKPPTGPYEAADNPVSVTTIGSTGSVGSVTACFAGNTGTWQAKFWGNANLTGPFLPYPGLSPAHNFPCV